MLIFLSHAHDDRDVVSALHDLFDQVFDTRVELQSSSNSESGPGPGDDILDWIQERVRESDRTLVALTRTSSFRPWLMWEAGAVTGVAIGSNKSASVTPVLFGIDVNHIPDPLKPKKAIRGDSDGSDGICGLLTSINGKLNDPLSGRVFDARCRASIPAYLERVEHALSQRSGGRDKILESSFAVADIRIDLDRSKSVEARAISSVFTASSKQADAMFHAKGSLIGTPIFEALGRLEILCDVDQWRGVDEEQTWLRGRLLDGRPETATRPLIFKQGPAAEDVGVLPRFRGKAFLPLIVQHEFGEKQLDLRMLYLQVCTRPCRDAKYWKVEPHDHWLSVEARTILEIQSTLEKVKDIAPFPGGEATSACSHDVVDSDERSTPSTPR